MALELCHSKPWPHGWLLIALSPRHLPLAPLLGLGSTYLELQQGLGAAGRSRVSATSTTMWICGYLNWAPVYQSTSNCPSDAAFTSSKINPGNGALGKAEHTERYRRSKIKVSTPHLSAVLQYLFPARSQHRINQGLS